MKTLACWMMLCAVVGAAEGESPDVETVKLPVTTKRVFADVVFKRPIVVTHAGDGSGRLFVAEQLGKIHVFPNDPDVEETELFINLEPKVTYKDKENEEGLLGLAFHPQYKKTGEFFVYYTTRSAPHVSVVSRFRVSKSNPNRADAEFEEELLRIEQPFWNHNGGTLAFGPDGMLYIAMGDGGKRDDPFKAGQDLGTLLGKILRIDVDHKDEGKNYAVPKDNPFVGVEGARPEVYALGFRNIWRMAFDRQTGVLWAGDVGQDTWEEIDIVVKGGNYGWNLKEATHNFTLAEGQAAKDLIDPIWEYSHLVGKSITGGVVYRGKRLPALAGKYLYGDYVAKRLWALDYDAGKRRATNYSLTPSDDPPLDVVTYGEDEQGEAYVTDSFGRVFTFVEAK